MVLTLEVTVVVNCKREEVRRVKVSKKRTLKTKPFWTDSNLEKKQVEWFAPRCRPSSPPPLLLLNVPLKMPSVVWTVVKLILTVTVLAAVAYGAKLLLDAINDGIKCVLFPPAPTQELTKTTDKGRNN